MPEDISALKQRLTDLESELEKLKKKIDLTVIERLTRVESTIRDRVDPPGPCRGGKAVIVAAKELDDLGASEKSYIVSGYDYDDLNDQGRRKIKEEGDRQYQRSRSLLE